MTKKLKDIRAMRVERPQRAKLSADEVIMRMDEFPERREQFIAAVQRTDEVLQHDDAIVLTKDDYNFFMKSLADEKEPSKRSRAAAGVYCRGRRKGVRYHT